jgi:hypothetical protein
MMVSCSSALQRKEAHMRFGGLQLLRKDSSAGLQLSKGKKRCRNP